MDRVASSYRLLGYAPSSANDRNKLSRRRKRIYELLFVTLCLGAYLVIYPLLSNSYISSCGSKLGTVEHFSLKQRKLPQAIIIGTRKCGTRALLRFLEINPVIKSAPREVHFFDRDENYKRGLGWYREQMPETWADEIVVEKSPAYFVTKGVPERIKAMNSSVKLVLILRNPVTRLISDFSQTIASRLGETQAAEDYEQDDYGSTRVNPTGKKPDMNTTLTWTEAEGEFKSHILRPDGGINDQRRIVKIGMYAMHLERWLSVFPRDQFHFVDGERLILRPHEELQRLERFLGLTPVIKEDHFAFSQKKGFYCLANETTTSRHRRDLNAAKLTCLGRSKGRRHVSVDSALVKRLEDFYAPHNEYLETLTGLKFNV